jgi:hypothetical protein
MKKLLSLTAISVAVMLVALPLAYGQGQEKGPEKGGQAPAQAEKTFEGQLTKVDANAKTISVKGSAGEMLFRYTDQTQVAGPDKDIQGLASKTGTPLKITYRDAGENHVATKIEVAEPKR